MFHSNGAKCITVVVKDMSAVIGLLLYEIIFFSKNSNLNERDPFKKLCSVNNVDLMSQ